MAAVLLVVFGALFAGADAAFADLLGGLVPDASVSGGPWHVVLFVIGVVGALVVAHTAAAPVQLGPRRGARRAALAAASSGRCP